MIVYAGGYFEIFETLGFVRLVLVLLSSAQRRLRHWLEDYLLRPPLALCHLARPDERMVE